MQNNIAYQKINNFYGDKRAKRSKVLLMNHINEGLLILDYLNADIHTKEAFCLHPLMQDTNILLETIEDSSYNNIDSKSIMLCMEYRHVANSFLSGKKKENVLPLINESIRQLLIADKVQNYKDFIIYHKHTHKNSKRLEEYFNEWLTLLNISIYEFHDYVLMLTLESDHDAIELPDSIKTVEQFTDWLKEI